MGNSQVSTPSQLKLQYDDAIGMFIDDQKHCSYRENHYLVTTSFDFQIQ